MARVSKAQAREQKQRKRDDERRRQSRGATVRNVAIGASVLGFAVMALAPTPIFATFGVLTAVMIVLALAAALVVLPSVLLLVTKAPQRDATDTAEKPELVPVG
ncbi:MAG: MMPL family transporter [Longimicrobiales bacterium]